MIFRQGTVEDSHTVFEIFRQSILDLGQRLGVMAITGGDDAGMWQRRRPLFEHLARTAEQFWIAEKDGQAIGYARSILRDHVRELTEFFVLPGHQSAGVGQELLARAFPKAGAEHRLVVATTDARAVARYLKTGVYPYFPAYHFSRTPETVPVETDLTFTPLRLDLEVFAILNQVDKTVLGFSREVDHRWLIEQRGGVLYMRNGEAVGYGYKHGPYALLDERNFPSVLAHAEREAATHGDSFGVEVPLINHTAVDYLLQRGCVMDTFFEFVMLDAPFGKFNHYIFTSPPFFL